MAFFKEGVTETQKRMVLSMLRINVDVLRFYIDDRPSLLDLETISRSLKKLHTYAEEEKVGGDDA